MADGQRMIEIYTGVMGAIADGNVGALEAVLTEDYSWHGNSGEEKDRAGALEMVQGYVTAFPDMKFVMPDVATAGDRLFVRWTVTGTHTGPLGDMPATGRAIGISGHVVVRFEGDMVAEEWELVDEALMMQQLEMAEG
jgi:steroid delta-isomerase-like uncharacterized protein